MFLFASSGGTFDFIPVARSSSRSSRPSGTLSASMESLLLTRFISGPLPAASAPVATEAANRSAANPCFMGFNLDLKDTLNYTLVRERRRLLGSPTQKHHGNRLQ